MYEQTKEPWGGHIETTAYTTGTMPERETEVWSELNRQEGQVTALHDALAKLTSRPRAARKRAGWSHVSAVRQAPPAGARADQSQFHGIPSRKSTLGGYRE